jgi:hypothetical protein
MGRVLFVGLEAIPRSHVLSPEIEPTVENLSMIRSHQLFRRSAIATGLVSLAAFAGTANAQMHDLIRHSNHGRTNLSPNRLGLDQAPRNDTTLAAGACGTGCFEEINQQPNGINGYFSDTGCDFCGGGQQSITDDIVVLAAFNVCDIQFWGGYYSGNSSPADAFTINILSDAGGCPGAAIYSESNVSVARVTTGNVLFGVNEWLYTATLAATVNLPVGSYFIEIFNNTGLGTDDWFWETGNSDPDYGSSANGFAFNTPGITWNCPLGIDMSMVVCGDVAPPPPPPPSNECTGGCAEAIDQEPNASNGYFSEQSCAICGGGAQVLAEDVTIPVPIEICNLNLTGGYFPANNPGTGDAFIVRIMGDAGGIPDTSNVIYDGIANPVTSTRVMTGNVLFGVDEWYHTITLAGTVTLPAAKVWIECYNNTTSTPDDWFWEVGDLDSNNGTFGSAFDFNAPGVNWTIQGVDLATRLCVSGDIGTKFCSATNNSTGFPADLTASGSASSGAGDLQLTSAPVPNQNSIFFHGANQTQLPFGNGFICAQGNIVRGAVVMAAANSASYTYDNSNAKHSLGAFIGQNRQFQHWFRDPMAGGAFFNTSNAISITVQP